MSSTPDAGMRVLIAGGGVAALEAALTLADIARGHVAVSVLAPGPEFVYRPMTVAEPFAYPAAHRYPLDEIVRDAGAELIRSELGWVDAEARVAHTSDNQQLPYDALLLALGASERPRFEGALTIDDHTLNETLRGLLRDIEEGYTRSVAFVSPARMGWQLPIYELALMTAGRAYDANVELEITIVTPEDTPLAIFGSGASTAIAALLARRGIGTLTSSYASSADAGKLVVNPGDRRLAVDRIVALPELYGPALRGIPAAEHGFIRVDPFMQVPDTGPVFAAGDATDFPVKHGGIAAQQAEVAARSIAALAGAAVSVEPFKPVIQGMLLTDARPLYLTARITGGHGFSSEISDEPTWTPSAKIVARHLAPYLDRRDRAAAAREP